MVRLRCFVTGVDKNLTIVSQLFLGIRLECECLPSLRATAGKLL